MNQGVQFPLAQAYVQLRAASLMRWQAADLFAQGRQPAFEVNVAKLLASQALWAAANAAMDTFGGYGATGEFGIERRFREARGVITSAGKRKPRTQTATPAPDTAELRDSPTILSDLQSTNVTAPTYCVSNARRSLTTPAVWPSPKIAMD